MKQFALSYVENSPSLYSRLYLRKQGFHVFCFLQAAHVRSCSSTSIIICSSAPIAGCWLRSRTVFLRFDYHCELHVCTETCLVLNKMRQRLLLYHGFSSVLSHSCQMVVRTNYPDPPCSNPALLPIFLSLSYILTWKILLRLHNVRFSSLDISDNCIFLRYYIILGSLLYIWLPYFITT